MPTKVDSTAHFKPFVEGVVLETTPNLQWQIAIVSNHNCYVSKKVKSAKSRQYGSAYLQLGWANIDPRKLKKLNLAASTKLLPLKIFF